MVCILVRPRPAPPVPSLRAEARNRRNGCAQGCQLVMGIDRVHLRAGMAGAGIVREQNRPFPIALRRVGEFRYLRRGERPFFFRLDGQGFQRRARVVRDVALPHGRIERAGNDFHAQIGCARHLDMLIAAARSSCYKTVNLRSMPLYELTPDSIHPVPAVRFSDAGIREHGDLQRILREQIEAISPDTLVIAEEFCEWEDSRRRIDLLGVDTDANLVVIELKRTEDGGHMELQAIRYAAMISTLTFERVVELFAAYLNQHGSHADARRKLLDHLGWENADEREFAETVRIVLASADFGKEMTTAVLWLNDQGLDVRCVRLRPYRHCDRLLVDIQQVIPLPEASDYTVQIRAKQQEARSLRRTQDRDFSKFILTLDGSETEPLNKRRAILAVVRFLVAKGASPDAISEALPASKGNGLFVSFPGELDSTEVSQIISQRVSSGDGRDYSRYFQRVLAALEGF